MMDHLLITESKLNHFNKVALGVMCEIPLHDVSNDKLVLNNNITENLYTINSY